MFKVSDKQRNVSIQNDYMLAKTLSMFAYDGLPDTIPAVELEKLLQRNGQCFVTEVGGDLYALQGSTGGEPDPYGNDTKFIASNPALNLSEQFDIATGGVLFQNDEMSLGLLPVIERFNTLMVDNQLSMDMASFNARMQTFISASDDKTRESAQLFINKLEQGEHSVIGDNAMFDGVKSHGNSGTSGTKITELIEYQQYLKSWLFGELGINSPFNMKRERLNTGEVEQHEDSVNIFADNMYDTRQKAVEEINSMYGLNVSVEFSGVWKERRKQAKPQTGSKILTGGNDE